MATPIQKITSLHPTTEKWTCHVHDQEMPCPECTKEAEERKEAERLQAKQEREDKLRAQQEHPERWLKGFGIAPKHLSYSFDGYKGEAITRVCREAVENRSSVFLTGKTGCGKTHLAVAMMRHMVQSADKPMPSAAYYGEYPYIFVTVPELLLEIRSTFSEKSKHTEDEIIEKYSSSKLLILDDLGSEKPSEFTEITLYLIIDRRNREDKWTIITSNYTLDQIETRLGARIASRLADMKVIKIDLPDWRKKR